MPSQRATATRSNEAQINAVPTWPEVTYPKPDMSPFPARERSAHEHTDPAVDERELARHALQTSLDTHQ